VRVNIVKVFVTMKELNERQKRLARQAVNNLKKLQEEGVVSLIIDGGGGNNGLHFWIPEGTEDDDAEEIINTEEFMDNEYYPSKSIGLRIDVIVP
jgi:uncharacterized protein YciI